MKVWLSSDLFRLAPAPAVSAADIIHLLATIQDLGHAALPEDDSAVKHWLATRPHDESAYVDMILQLGLQQVNLPLMEVSVQVGLPTDWGTGQLTLTDAIELLRTPLRVLVENRRADWAFLRRIAGPERRKRLDAAHEAGRLVVEHGGGVGEIKWRMEELATEPDRARSFVDRLRLWLLFDRDTNPHDRSQPSDDSNEIITLAQSVPGPWPLAAYQLIRRSIENYLPGDALYHWAGHVTGAEYKRRRECVDAFLSTEFGPTRRISYNMKNGLAGDTPKSTRKVLRDPRKPDHQQEPGARRLTDADLDSLFHHLTDELLDSLQEGFGEQIAALYSDTHIEDRSFEEVFLGDAAAERQRRDLLTSLFARL